MRAQKHSIRALVEKIQETHVQSTPPEMTSGRPSLEGKASSTQFRVPLNSKGSLLDLKCSTAPWIANFVERRFLRRKEEPVAQHSTEVLYELGDHASINRGKSGVAEILKPVEPNIDTRKRIE